MNEGIIYVPLKSSNPMTANNNRIKAIKIVTFIRETKALKMVSMTILSSFVATSSLIGLSTRNSRMVLTLNISCPDRMTMEEMTPVENRNNIVSR